MLCCHDEPFAGVADDGDDVDDGLRPASMAGLLARLAVIDEPRGDEIGAQNAKAIISVGSSSPRPPARRLAP